MRRALLLSFTIFTAACSTKPPAAAPRSQPEARADHAPQLRSEDCVAIQDVQRALQARDMAFQDCYVDGLSLDPHLAGTVTLRVVIPPSGAVDDVGVASSDLAS